MQMWQAASWAAIGSAANVGVVYSEALSRVSGGWPWQVEHGGPGGKQALVGILIKLAVSVGVVAALSTTPAVVPNAWTALAFGVGGPSIIKKVAQTYAEYRAPSTTAPGPPGPPAAERPGAPEVAQPPTPEWEGPGHVVPDAPTQPYQSQPSPRDAAGPADYRQLGPHQQPRPGPRRKR